MLNPNITCSDISDSNDLVWELACIYEDEGFGPAEYAIIKGFSAADRAILQSEMDETDAKWRAAQPEPVAKAPVLRNFDPVAAYYHDRILAADERDFSRWT